MEEQVREFIKKYGPPGHYTITPVREGTIHLVVARPSGWLDALAVILGRYTPKVLFAAETAETADAAQQS